MARLPELIDVERIFLYEENPRHEPIESQPEIVEHLCKDEQVFNLARNISEAGPNPLELLGLVQISGSGASAAKKTYQVWEGNRRICAIKLLNDPDLAPPHLRKDFARLASVSDHVPIKRMTSVIFDDHDELKYWMGIIHDGAQAGVGRLDWDSQQKARHFGSSRNRVALAVLDAAEAMNLISKDDRSGKLTTAQRYLNSSVVREALGLDTTNPEDITYNRPQDDFQKQLAKFVGDLKDGKVTSRSNRAQVDAYGRKLERNSAITGERIEPLSLRTAASSPVKKGARKGKLKKPRKRTRLDYDKRLSTAVEKLGNAKLESLYYSVCSISIDDHAPLLTVGVWAFVESLSALAGKKAENDFGSFFSNQRLAEYGLGTGKGLAPIRDALGRIQRNGNATKHHEISATFDGKQLANDLATITQVLIKTVDSIALKK